MLEDLGGGDVELELIDESTGGLGGGEGGEGGGEGDDGGIAGGYVAGDESYEG